MGEVVAFIRFEVKTQILRILDSVASLCLLLCNSLQNGRGSVSFPAAWGSCDICSDLHVSQPRDVQILMHRRFYAIVAEDGGSIILSGPIFLPPPPGLTWEADAVELPAPSPECCSHIHLGKHLTSNCAFEMWRAKENLLLNQANVYLSICVGINVMVGAESPTLPVIGY